MHPGLPSYPSGRSRIPPRKRTGKSGGKPSTLAPATLPLQSPQQAAWHSPRFSQGPMVASPPRKSHSESFVGPALGTAPAHSSWGGSVIKGPRGARRPPAHVHPVGPGTEANPARSQPRHAPAQEPPASCIASAPLPTGTGPYRTRRSASTQGLPHIVCFGTTHACKNRSPPPLKFTRIGRGGETPPPLPFSKALCGVPRPAPGSRAPGAISDGRSTLEDGRGGGIRPNGGFQSRLLLSSKGLKPLYAFFLGR